MSESTKAVFLSYASQDSEAAKRICEALRQAGVEVWFDQNELVGGDAWDQKIRKQISECALFMPVISANTQARLEGYFRLEWKLAALRTHTMADEKAFLLPVTIDDTREGTAKVPAEFKAVQWTRLTDGSADAAFCHRVKHLLSGGPATMHSSRTEAGRTPMAARSARSMVWPFVAGLALVAGFGVWYFWSGRAPAGDVAPATPAAGLRAKVEQLFAQAEISREDLVTAAGLLEQIMRLEPNDAATWVLVVRLDLKHVDLGVGARTTHLQAARDHLARAVALASHDFDVRLARAEVLLRQDNWNPQMAAEAEPLLRQLHAERPEDPRTLFALGDSLNVQGRLDEQLAVLDRINRLPGQAAKAERVRLLALFRACRFREAAESHARLPRGEWTRETAVAMAALEIFWRGDPPAARAVLDALPASAFVEDGPGAMAFWVAYMARNYEGALACSRRLAHDYIESSMFGGPRAFLSGLALMRAGRVEAARTEFRSALRLVEQRLATAPNDEVLLQLQSYLLAQLGQHEDAQRIWRVLLELDLAAQGQWRPAIALLLESPDQALDRIEASLRSPSWVWNAAFLRLAPEFDSVRALPRFQAILAAAEADARLAPQPGPAPDQGAKP